MAPRRYLNFDLLLDQEGEGQYQALVTGSPLGETPSVRFRLPFDATTLENLLLKLDPGRSGTRRVGGSPAQQAAMDFGGPLFEAVFRDEMLLAWSRSMDRAREEGDGLRLRLRLSDAPAIAGLPWELLYDQRINAFLAQSERTPVVRFLDLPRPPRPIAVDGPLRVLVVISSPTDLEELDVEAEWARIQEALAPKVADRVVVVDRLPEATLTELGRWLRRRPTHVVHFVGHGDFDQRIREGVIYFQDDRGRSKAVTSSVLGPFLRDHDPLRMVVLNACRSARADLVDPYGGMAQGLVQQDATAVVAMQFPISDRAAVAFTGAFYGALVDGLPVDQAASSARKALLADFSDEWATPVLFLRSPDGDIFQQVHAPVDEDAADPGADIGGNVGVDTESGTDSTTGGDEAVAASGPDDPARASGGSTDDGNRTTAVLPVTPPEATPDSASAPPADAAVSHTPRGFSYTHPVRPETVAGPRARPAPTPPPRQPAPAPPPSASPPPPPPPSPPPGPRPRRRLLVLGLAGAAALLVVLAILGAVSLLGDEPGGGGGNGGGGGEQEVALPRSEPLTDSQLLVAAGTSQRDQHVWLLDLDSPSSATKVSRGTTREWIPVLNPARTTVVFARERPGDAAVAELMVAGAADGAGVRPFFADGAPAECAGTMLRPAWFPDRDALAVPCTDTSGVAHLVVVDLAGELLGTLDPPPELGPLATLGDPTISADGSAVVVWGNPAAPAAGGSLYVVDVASGTWSLLRSGQEEEEYSDAVFSEQGDRLAFRQDTGGGNFRVVVASVTASGLGPGTVVAAAPGKDQDPMFSVDGTQVAYGHVDPGQNGQRQELRVVAATGGSSFRPVQPPGGLDFLSVPAWSRR